MSSDSRSELLKKLEDMDLGPPQKEIVKLLREIYEDLEELKKEKTKV